VFTRIANLVEELPNTNLLVLAFGLVGLLILFISDRLLPGKPVSLFVVIISILVIAYTSLGSSGIHLAGEIPNQLPTIRRPSIRLRDVDGIVDLAFACFLMGYIETISAARTFAMKNNYSINARQELFSLCMANIASSSSSGYVVAGVCHSQRLTKNGSKISNVADSLLSHP
jgi:MFS superfamily sulfate permease-like transporter